MITDFNYFINLTERVIAVSIGIGAYVKKICEDDGTVLYSYGGYNLNEPEDQNNERISDGIILIQKECFIEPEIHTKIKKMSSGRKKLITKIIPLNVDFGNFIIEGKIIVENCSNCWHKIMNELQIDMMACRLLYHIFQRYQTDGKIPEKIHYFV